MIPAARDSTAPCALDRGAYTSRVLVVASRDERLSFRGFAVRQKFVLSRQHRQHPRRARSPELLWRDAVRECIIMEGDVVAQTEPTTVLFCGLRHTSFLAGGKVLP